MASGSTGLLRGALVTIDTTQPAPQTIPFQYNPETLKRTLQSQLVGGEQNDRSQGVRFAGVPIETISVEVELDYVDASGVADVTEDSMGVYPLLSALELLVYPPSSGIVSAANQLSSGTLEIAPAMAPLTLFVWGQRRVVPVSITQYEITEQFFDQTLTPIRATVSLSMRTLSASDLASGTPGYSQYLVYQQTKESMAGGARVANGQSVTGATY
jgi:hypothetical protein